MPPGTPYKCFLRPYFSNVRVDEFTDVSGQKDSSNASVHLLTHTHSDHIVGLQAKSFGQPVICSKDSKEMLLRHEVYGERALLEMDMRAERTRTYKHLKVDPVRGPDGQQNFWGSRDLLRALPLNTPTEVEISPEEITRITLIDANHCPGSVMYLIEGVRRNVLHTGDFRAEPWFLESLRHNEHLQPYLAPTTLEGSNSGSTRRVGKTLDAIYLDTASVMSTVDVPTKKSAVDGLIKIMKMYPKDVCFYINAWTWGYEDILKAVAREFDSPIHVDRYKHSILTHLHSDPFLSSITTNDDETVRFHACERFSRCPMVDLGDYDHLPENGGHRKPQTRQQRSKLGKRVVYVNPVSSMSKARWEIYQEDTRRRLAEGEEINSLLAPVCRHSPLPELQEFVKMFRPLSIVPNTLDPSLNGLDWLAINQVFKPYLAFNHSNLIGPHFLPREDWRSTLRTVEKDMKSGNTGDPEPDVDLKNAADDGMAEIAARWSSADLDGRKSRKVLLIKSWLGITGLSSPPKNRIGKAGQMLSSSPIKPSDDDEDTESEDESQVGRTMHLLFAGSDYRGSSVSFDLESQPDSQVEVQAEEVVQESVRVITPCTPPSTRRGNRLSNDTSHLTSYLSVESERCRVVSELKPKRRADIFYDGDTDIRDPSSANEERPTQRRKTHHTMPTPPGTILPSSSALGLPLVEIINVAQPPAPPPRTTTLPEIKPMQGPHPPSRHRSQKLERRLQLAQHLALSSPNLVSPHYAKSREKLINKHTRAKNREELQELEYNQWEAIPEAESQVLETERMKVIKQGIQEDIRMERRIKIPPLECTDRWKE